jgi:hypothetical protein
VTGVTVAVRLAPLPPNTIPLAEHPTRWDFADPMFAEGIAEDFPIVRRWNRRAAVAIKRWWTGVKRKPRSNSA